MCAYTVTVEICHVVHWTFKLLCEDLLIFLFSLGESQVIYLNAGILK